MLTAAPLGAGWSRTGALSSPAASWQASPPMHDNHYAVLPSLLRADNTDSASGAPRATAICVMRDSHLFIAREDDALACYLVESTIKTKMSY